MPIAQDLTNREILQIEDAVISMAEALNVPKETIVKILLNGTETVIVPKRRFDYMLDRIRNTFFVKKEKTVSFTANPELIYKEEVVGVSLDISKYHPALDRDKEYIVLVKEIE